MRTAPPLDLPPRVACDDATVCNGHETCGCGTCNRGTPLNCDDGGCCTGNRHTLPKRRLTVEVQAVGSGQERLGDDVFS